ncbi:MAG: YafY family transcriptional regulator, partial [Verrucomicrobiae bacterium]|nr:YafY family transcriptional regulator [Verrucomicrobiae bacterium]
MNRVDRLLALILFLQSRRVVTAEELAGHFELSVRTIYRDLAALGEAGVPIVAEAGVGYSLLRGYHLPPVNFTPEEADALVTGGLLVERFAGPEMAVRMQSALRKVRAVLPRDHQDRVARLERSLATTARVPQPAQANLSLVQQAIAEQRVLRFRYESPARTGPIQREVEPCGLLHYLERWHLIGWCRLRRDYRDFRTDRMEDLVLGRETFPARDDFKLAQYLRAMPKPTLRARIRFTPAAADRAQREWWLGVLAEERGTQGVTLTLAAVEWERLVHWLLSFGSEATVESPADLRQRLVRAVQSVAAHHQTVS